ncbi:unnamed protein product, partial [Meganyctiphanes norvegica]
RKQELVQVDVKKRVKSSIPEKRQITTDFQSRPGSSTETTKFAYSNIQSSSEESSLDSFSSEASSPEIPEERNHKEVSPSAYGALVWAQFENWRPSPAIIIDPNEVIEHPQNGNLCIFWLGYNQVGDISKKNTTDFVEHFSKHYAQRTSEQQYKRGVFQALQECHHRAGKKANLNIDSSNIKSLVLWAQKKFPLKEGQLKDLRTNAKSSLLSAYVSQYLSVIKKVETYSNVQEWNKKIDYLNEVRDNRRDVKLVCITCPDVELPVVAQHPIYEGGLCNTCKTDREFMNKNIEDEDKSNLCCVCMRPGKIVICSTCSNGYCESCIRLLVDSKEFRNVKKLDPWECYLHNDDDHIVGLMKKRANWEDNINILETPQLKVPIDETPDITSFMPKRKMKILSLYDGIGSGLVALHKLGIQVEKCYASEIDESAITVTSVQFDMDSINNKQQTELIHVGDVENYTKVLIKEQGPFDLLIGGSPCNDLANVNPRRRGLFDPESSGQLFFHYFRILKEIQSLQGSKTHLFWLFENVFHMPEKYKKQINIFLGCDPVVVDAQYFTAMRRKRNFWGNIPRMYDPLPSELLSNTPKLQNYLAKVRDRIAIVDQIKTVTSNNDCFKIGGNVECPIKQGDDLKMPMLRELEALFGFPNSWTDVGINNQERKAQLARSWCVQVIMHILNPLKKYFLTDDDISHTMPSVADGNYNKFCNKLSKKASNLHISPKQKNLILMAKKNKIQSNLESQSRLNSEESATSSMVDSAEFEQLQTNAQKLFKITSVTTLEENYKKENVEIIDLSDSEIEDMEIDTADKKSPSPPALNPRKRCPSTSPRTRTPSPNVMSSEQTMPLSNIAAPRPISPFPSISKCNENDSDSKEEEEDELPDLNDTSSESPASLKNYQSKEDHRMKSHRLGDSLPNNMSGINILSPEDISSKTNTLECTPIIETIIKSSFDVNKKINSRGETAMIKACMHNKLDEVRSLLLVPGIDVNIADNAGWTPLHEAALKNHVEIISLILDHTPPDISLRCNIAKKGGAGMTALHDAVDEGNKEAAILLLEYGGEQLLNIENEDGHKPHDLTKNESMKRLLESYEGKQGKMDDSPGIKLKTNLKKLRLSQNSHN